MNWNFNINNSVTTRFDEIKKRSFSNFLKNFRIWIFLIIVVLIIGVIIYKTTIVSGLSYTWVQSDWSSGVSEAYPNVNSNLTNWTYYSSKGNYISSEISGQLVLYTSATIPTSTETLSSTKSEIASVYDSTSTKVYIFGGYNYDENGNPQFLDVVEQYDPISNIATTSNIGQLPVALRGHSADISTADGKIYIFGGYASTTESSYFNRNIYSFDPAISSEAVVDTGHDLYAYREYAPAVYAPNSNKFFIFGGFYLDGSNNPQYLSSINWYDTNTGTVGTTTVGFAISGTPHQIKAASAEYYPVDGMIYIFGGYDATDESYSNRIWKFDPTNPNAGATPVVGATFSNGIAYSTATYYQSLGGATIKKIYIMGGYRLNGDSSVYYSNVWNFDGTTLSSPASETFGKNIRGGDAIFCSYNHEIYFFGGYSDDGGGFLDSIYDYKLYSHGPLISSPFNTGDPTTVVSELIWNESVVEGQNDVLFQIRTAPNVEGCIGGVEMPYSLEDDCPGTWSDWCGPEDGFSNQCSTSTYFTESGIDLIDQEFQEDSNDQWIQYKIIFLTDALSNSPTLLDLSLSFVVNTEPVVSDVSASQDPDGYVNVLYTVSGETTEESTTTNSLFYDIEITLSSTQSLSDTSITITGANVGKITSATGTIMIENEIMYYSNKVDNVLSGITRGYAIDYPTYNTGFYRKAHDSGTAVWFMANDVTGDGYIPMGSGLSMSWLARSDVNELYSLNSVKIKVVAHDGNLARQIGNLDSATFEFDTTDPVIGTPTGGGTGVNINGNATTTYLGNEKTLTTSVNLNFNASDDNSSTTPVWIMRSNYNDFREGSWAAYSSSLSWELLGNCTSETGCERTVYVKFKDAAGNLTGVYSDTIWLDTNGPIVPTNMYIQEISYMDEISSTTNYRIFVSWDQSIEPDWVRYEIYRSLDDFTYTLYATTSHPDVDHNFYIDGGLTQDQTYYYKVRMLDDIGNSEGTSSSVNMKASGNPNDIGSPNISNVDYDDDIRTNMALIEWDTDEPASSYVLYSLDENVPPESSSQGVSGYRTSHSVTLVGLESNTTYYFKIYSCDVSNNCQGTGYDEIRNFTTDQEDTTAPVISNVADQDITEDSARITWDTVDEANSFVEYSLTPGFTEGTGTLQGKFEWVYTHDITLIGLEPDTTYYYKARSADESNNFSYSGQGDFTTLASSGDVRPPEISNATSTSIQYNTATIIWDTDEPASSYVEFGIDDSYGRIYGQNELVYSHSVTLPLDLSPSTEYHFRVRSKDIAQNEGFSLEDMTFTTAVDPNDTTPPVISSVVIGDPGMSSITITWSTIDDPSDSYIDYSEDTSYALGQGKPTMETSHEVTLVGLIPNKTYYFRIKSTDPSGNQRIDNNSGSGYMFRTLPSNCNPPVITNIQYQNVTHNQATIVWTTDIAANSYVDYGLSTDYDGIQGNFASSTSHSVTLNGLLSEATYHFRIRSESCIGVGSASGDNQFNTEQAPDITPPRITDVNYENVALTSADIVWTTDEAADSYVFYGTSTEMINKVATNDDGYVLDHRVSLSNLEGNTTYYFSVKSVDRSSNATTSDNNGAYYSFTTVADITPPVISAVDEATVDRNSATVIWTTDEPATSQATYSLSEDMSNSSTTAQILDLTLSHSVLMSNLNASTTYYYYVRSLDSSANEATSSIYSFTTATAKEDTISPVISAVSATSSIGLTSATITWTTDEDSDSIVDYGLTTGLGSLAGSTSDSTKNHSVNLINLSSNTTYYFQVRSQDSSGNTGTDNNNGAYYSFTTTADNDLPIVTLVDKVADRNSATIIWTTNEQSTSQVDYSTSPTLENASSTDLVTDLTFNHSVVITGLASNTRYYYRAKSKDAADNTGVSIIDNFLTSGASEDGDAPEITDVATSSVTRTSAIITWKTLDEAGNSIVDYGPSPSLGLLAGNLDESTTTHSVTLAGLSEGTLYYFQARTQDIAGNSDPADNGGAYYTFTTLSDEGEPQIDNVTIPLITNSSAVVLWTTDEDSSSQVAYGTSNAFGSLTTEDTTMTKVHAVTITGLTAQTQYYVKAISRDATDNTGEDDNEGAGYGFRTTSDTTVVIIGGGGGGAQAAPVDTEAPTISGISTADVKADSIKIRWTTNENASRLVEYGFNKDYGYMAGSYEIGGSSHEVEIKELMPDTVYNFRVISLDSKGNISRSMNDVFKTKEGASNLSSQDEMVNTILGMIKKMSNPYDITQVSKALQETAERRIAAPIIAGELPKIEPYEDSARIIWITDKESNSMVAYASHDEYNPNASEPYKNIVGNADESITFHSVDLTGLRSSTMYHVQVRSKMSIGPEAKSQDITFFTKSVNLEISNFRISKIENNSVDFSWDTNIPSSGIIEYTDMQSVKTLSQGDPNLSKRHTLKLENLKQDITYSAQLIAKDEYGTEVKSDKVQFTTGKDDIPPEITQVRANSTLYPGKEVKIQTIVTWNTNEQSTSQVFWQEGTAKNAMTADSPKDSSMVTKHVVVLTRFKPSTVYKFWVESEDLFGNKSKSREFTILTPKQTETVVEVIIKNFEDIFGWTKKLQ